MILLNGMQKEDFTTKWNAKRRCMILLNGMQKEDFNAWYY